MVAANPNAPFGLRAIRHLFGGVIREARYDIADQYATSLFLGDPVVAQGSGKTIGIASAATSGKLTGVFVGCEYVDALGNTQFSKYWPASTVTKNAAGAKALIIDDPHVLFEIQFNTLGVGDVRALCNLASGAGNTFTGQSGWTAVNPPGSGENQLKIYSLASSTAPGGIPSAYGAFAVAEVLLAQHEMAGNMANL